VCIYMCVCMCVCVCTYLCMYVSMSVGMYLYMYVWTYVCECVCMCICEWNLITYVFILYMSVCIHACMSVYLPTDFQPLYMSVCIHACMSVYLPTDFQPTCFPCNFHTNFITSVYVGKAYQTVTAVHSRNQKHQTPLQYVACKQDIFMSWPKFKNQALSQGMPVGTLHPLQF